jgi:hypothetical protein
VVGMRLMKLFMNNWTLTIQFGSRQTSSPQRCKARHSGRVVGDSLSRAAGHTCGTRASGDVVTTSSCVQTSFGLQPAMPPSLVLVVTVLNLRIILVDGFGFFPGSALSTRVTSHSSTGIIIITFMVHAGNYIYNHCRQHF